MKINAQSAPLLHQAAARSARGSGFFAIFGLSVLIVAAVFGAMDRQILLLLGEPMRQSLKMSDTMFGVLQGTGITLFAGAAAIPVGWLGDKFGRRHVLAGCVIVWATATAACGFAQTIGTMFTSAIFLGLGEAGITPIVFGMIPHIVPANRRVLANGIYAMALLLGTGAGASLSGMLVERIDSFRPLLPIELRNFEAWRLALMAVALPGPIVACLILLIRKHPSALNEPVVATGSGASAGAFLRMHRRAVFLIFGGVGLGQMGLLAVADWAPIAAMRYFGATAAQVGSGIGSAYLLSSAVGAVLGGLATKFVRRRSGVALPIYVIVVGLLCGGIAALFAPLAGGPVHLYLLFGVQLAAIVAGSVLAPTLLQDMTPDSSRSVIIAAGNMFTTILTSLGPVFVGVLSDHFLRGHNGLLWSISVVSSISLVCGALLLIASASPFVRAVRACHPDLVNEQGFASTRLAGA